jgi:transcription elongation factor/antiterminator RfaH
LRRSTNWTDCDINSGSDTCRWYAVHTLPHREFGAAKQLEFQGYQVFLPTHWKTVRHARKFRTVRAAFFPRYLFVRLNLARDRWRPVNGTFGVASLVMANDLPMAIPHGVVEALGAMTDTDGILTFSSQMQPGEKVRILTGPFADRIGELVHADDKNRVQILLDVMGVRTTVRVTTQALAPVA